MSTITLKTANFSPDGFAMRDSRTGAGRDYRAGTTRRLAPETAEAVRAASQHEQPLCHNQDGYDEGLVHSHGWACNG